MATDNSTCVICQKPLGQESKDSDFTVCHEHRKCTSCGQQCLPAEIEYCLIREIPIKHYRCQTLTHLDRSPLPEPTPLNQVDIDLINFKRLTTTMSLDLSHFTFEQKYEFLKQTQDLAAVISVAIRREKQDQVKKEQKDKESQKAEQAKQESRTSTRPAGVSPNAPNEQAIAWFMETYHVERKTAIKELTNRDKAIATMQKYGTSYEDAVETARDQLDKKYKIGKYAVKPNGGSDESPTVQ